MMEISKSRYSGQHPLRPGLGPEYALAVAWAEGGLMMYARSNKELIIKFRFTPTFTTLSSSQLLARRETLRVLFVAIVV